MYQFTTTTVINSAKDSNGITDKYVGDANAFAVTRVGKFLKNNIETVHKKAFTPGVKEVATITIANGAEGDIVEFAVDIKLTGSVQSEYANYTLDFKKPVVVEVVYKSTAALTAAEIVKQLKGLKNRYGHSYFEVSANNAVITLTAKENVQLFNSIVLSKVEVDTNSIIQYKKTVLATGTIVTKGKVGFGDDAWMIKSIMVPTYENVRVFGLNAEERPIMGGNYSQFTLRYAVDKHVDDGIVSGGKSITTYVFYVKSDLVAGFEAALTATKELDSMRANTPDTVVTTKPITVENAIGVITAVSSNTNVATVAVADKIVTVTGILDGNVNITITDASGNVIIVPVVVNVA